MAEMFNNNQIGESEEFYSFQENLRRAASVDRSVLLIGERGSGKEFAASRLHYLSSRWNNSFVKLNCAALPPSLIESELFGHVKGAYTGADRERKGRFEEADGGTLFLDEIGLIPFEVQEKILRVVEYGTFERVGSSETKEIDVRIIGAANQDLPAMCREGKFKQDLLDRLSFEVLFVPPLRARKGDITVLAEHFAQKMGKELGRKGRISFSDSAAEKLTGYGWPGNIRELKNTVERAVYRASGNVIEDVVLDPFVNPYTEITVEKSDSHEEVSSEQSGSTGTDGKREIIPAADKTQLDSGSDNNSLYQVSADCVSGSFEGSIMKKLIQALIAGAGNSERGADFHKITDIVKKELISSALSDTGNNQKHAASLLNLSYDQFRGIYRKYFT